MSKSEIEMLDKIEVKFLDLVGELECFAKSGGPLVFVPACAVVEYLAKAVAGKDSKGPGYKKFVSTWLSKVRSDYVAFTYSDGTQDLPTQMYHVLRCGVVHSLSLVPDSQSAKAGGRARSIVLCHRQAGVQHLSHHTSSKIKSAAVFVVEDFIDDIRAAVGLVFAKARTDADSRHRILTWFDKHPLISGGF